MPDLSAQELTDIMPRADTAKWLAALNDAMREWKIDSAPRMAAFLAQIAHESSDLNRLDENLRYTAKRLRDVWPKRFPSLKAATPYANNPEKLANRVYAGRLGNADEASGDGWKYRGRGLIQITGLSNYESCKDALDIDVVSNPDRLLEPAIAARSAAWFWNSHGLNALADHAVGTEAQEDFVQITMIINGGQVGLSDRLAVWERARGALGA